MNRRGETTGETSRSPEANPPERQNATKIIYIVYLIAALDVTWMFLQFSVTPVSIYQTGRSRKPRFPCVQWMWRRLRKRSWWIWFIHAGNLFNRRCFFMTAHCLWRLLGLLNGSHEPWNKPRFAVSHQRLNTFRKMRGTSSNFSASLKKCVISRKTSVTATHQKAIHIYTWLYTAGRLTARRFFQSCNVIIVQVM